MSNYTPATNFAAKDALVSGNPAKVVKGTEISAEFNAIQSAIATKADSNSSNALTAGSTTVSYLNNSGDIAMTGTGKRITGDFSNATAANRVMFQTSTANGSTIVGAMANGTGTNSQFTAFSGSDPANASTTVLQTAPASGSNIIAGQTGAGSYLPMVLITNGSEKLRIAADATGTYTFGGTAPRITGDFSNATPANRVMFQTSTTNTETLISAIPNGTGAFAGSIWYSSSDPANASTANVAAINTVDVRIQSSKTGTGTYLPMTFYTGGAEAMRIDTSRNVGVGVTPTGTEKFVSKSSQAFGAAITARSLDATSGSWARLDVTHAGATSPGFFYQTNTGRFCIRNDAATPDIAFEQSGVERFKVDSSGNALVVSATGLGYGTGAGGTVTQATSRTTAVTLNKPTGQITLFSAAGSASPTSFVLNNSLISPSDTVLISGKSGFVNAYTFQVTGVGAGTVGITFWSTGGTSVDAPVINFTVIKGATA